MSCSTASTSCNSSLLMSSNASLMSKEEESAAAVIVSDTPFLDTAQPSGALPRFESSELVLGNLVDRGSFTETHEISDIDRSLDFQANSASEDFARFKVWKATTKKRRKQSKYSLKHVSRGLQTEQEVQRAVVGLTIEANYLHALDHANIIKLQGLCTTTVALDYKCYDYHALITTCIAETLPHCVDRWNDEEEDPSAFNSDMMLHMKTNYAFQMADALCYLHDRKIVFRNLTLNSMGLSKKTGEVQLMNFDCVKEMPGSFLEDGFMGAKTYMALEMAQGSKYDFKVDSYSWAVCFFEMLTQEPAYETTTDGEIIRENNVWSPSLEGLDYIPAGIQDLLQDAWETDPKDRVDMYEVKKHLEWILFGTEGDESDARRVSDIDESQTSCIAPMTRGEYNPFAMGDESVVGLDLDESSPVGGGGGMDIGQSSMRASTRRRSANKSFIPSDLLLNLPGLIGAREMETPEDSPDVISTTDFDYYTIQEGLVVKKDALPPLSFMPSRRPRRRRSSLTTTVHEMAICA